MVQALAEEQPDAYQALSASRLDESRQAEPSGELCRLLALDACSAAAVKGPWRVRSGSAGHQLCRQLPGLRS